MHRRMINIGPEDYIERPLRHEYYSMDHMGEGGSEGSIESGLTGTEKFHDDSPRYSKVIDHQAEPTNDNF